MVLGTTPQVLLLGPEHQRSRDVRDVLQKKGLLTQRREFDPSPSRELLRSADMVVCILDPRDTDRHTDCLMTLLNRVQAENVATLVWGTPDNFAQPDALLVECISASVGLDEVVQRLTALARYAPLVKRMERELQALQRLGNHLNRYFEQIDQELRLAGQLQRDFLPQYMPDVPTLSFAQLYRPAGWVSGDIYDVFTIDHQHIGMFIADAMGHGTAAGLMTMFLRRALVTRQLQGNTVCVKPPAEAVRQLHEELARQELPHAQFVTAAYAIIDVESLEIRLARGGHPHPLQIDAEGEIRELRCQGGLLGVSGVEPEFDEYHGRLAPGDKVVFYTDGLEEVFIIDRNEQGDHPKCTHQLREWARLDAAAFVTAIGEHLDRREGSLNPADDVTVVVLQVAR